MIQFYENDIMEILARLLAYTILVMCGLVFYAVKDTYKKKENTIHPNFAGILGVLLFISGLCILGLFDGIIEDEITNDIVSLIVLFAYLIVSNVLLHRYTDITNLFEEWVNKEKDKSE